MIPFQIPTPDAAAATGAPGSKDGRGCADHDQPYTFGRRPRAVAPFPVTARQYGRLLALRGCVADGLLAADDLDASGLARRSLATEEQATSNATLFHACSVCGAVIAGAHQGSLFIACPKCAQDGGRDQAARALLLTAGVLEDSGESAASGEV